MKELNEKTSSKENKVQLDNETMNLLNETSSKLGLEPNKIVEYAVTRFSDYTTREDCKHCENNPLGGEEPHIALSFVPITPQVYEELKEAAGKTGLSVDCFSCKTTCQGLKLLKKHLT